MSSLDIQHRIDALPIWHGEVSLEPLPGGLSNLSFVASCAGDRYVVRIGEDLPFHHVFREREIAATRAAHAAGFAPELVYAEPGVMVSRFIDGVTYDNASVRENLARIASRMRAFHRTLPRQIPGPAILFWPFHVIRDYARMLEDTASPWRSRLPKFLQLANELEAAQTPLAIEYGHNDLLPANFIDDGEQLWIIDYEYAGFSTCMFDLAGIASNAGFDHEQSLELLAVYFERTPGKALVRSHAAMQCASLLREAMWSMVSNEHMRTPNVDYVAYANENLSALDVALERYRSLYA